MDTADPASATVIYTVEGGVGTIMLNRPDRLNAWNREMEAEFRRVVDGARSDAAVRAIVVTGAGRAFCAGADFDLLDAATGGERLSGDEGPFLPTSLIAVPKPVIAAVNGPAAGLGLVVALCCDVRFASAGAKLTSSFARRGLIAEYGSSWLLPRLVGTANALDVLLSGRTFLAEEAERMGVVNRVVAPADLAGTVHAYARDLAANCSPLAMRTIKGEVYRHLGTDLETAVEESVQLMYDAIHGGDAREGVASYLEKRAAEFPPLTGPA